MKKMVRKLLTAAISVAIVASSSITGFAGTKHNAFEVNVDKAAFPGWIVKTNDATFGEGATAEIREGVGIDGGNTLYLNSVNSATTGKKIHAYCDSIGMLYGGTYEISFKFKFDDWANDKTENKVGSNKIDVKTGASNPNGFNVFFGTNGDGTMNGWGTYTIEDLGNGWYSAKYQKEVTVSTGGSAIVRSNKYRYLKVSLDQGSGGAGVLVDDIKVARVDANKTALNENLVYNGDFEVTKRTGTSKSEYDISDIIVGEANTELTLSWNNATNSGLQKVEVYDITDESNPVKLEANIAATPGAKVRHKITGLTQGTYHYYKVISTFANGKISESILAGANAQQAQIMMTNADAWRYSTSGSAVSESEKRLVSAEIDERIKVEGDASIRIKTGHTLAEENARNTGVNIISSTIVRPYFKTDGTAASTPIVPSADIKYCLLSMWVKTEDVGYYTINFGGKTFGRKGTIPTGTDAGDENNELIGTKGSDLRTNDWTYFEALIPADGSGNMQQFEIYTLGSRAGTLWIDNIQFYPCSSAGVINAGATNLFADAKYDAGFEKSSDELDKILKDAPKNVKAVGGNGYVTLTWDDELAAVNSQNNKEHKKIYFINDDGEYIYKGKAYKGSKGMTFNNLENDVTYKIAVVNCGLFGGESPEAIVTATTVAPQFEIGEFELYNGTTKLQAVELGTLTAKINIENNKIADGIKATLIVAVYASDDTLKHAYYDDGNTDGKVAVGKETLVVENVVVEAGDKLKTFLWDGFDTIIPIKPNKQW